MCPCKDPTLSPTKSTNEYLPPDINWIEIGVPLDAEKNYPVEEYEVTTPLVDRFIELSTDTLPNDPSPQYPTKTTQYSYLQDTKTSNLRGIQSVISSHGKEEQACPAGHAVGPLTNHGGVVIANAVVVPIFLGSFWESDAGANSHLWEIIDYMNKVLPHASYVNPINQYGIAGAQRYINAYIGRSFNQAAITESTIRSWVQAWDAAGYWPADSGNKIFAIYFPKQTQVTSSQAGKSCEQWCGMHGYAGSQASQKKRYILMPYLGEGSTCLGRCHSNTVKYSFGSVLSHEVAETQTDPDLRTWWNPRSGSECGDAACNGNFFVNTISGNTYAIQREFSNNACACSS